MAIERAGLIGESVSVVLARLVAGDGSSAHPHVQTLTLADAPARDVVDALHLLCMAHGQFPGLVDHAGSHEAVEPVRRWIEKAAMLFAGERQALAQLVAASGPLPSTPGHAECEAAVTALRHALDTLGKSERQGCAFGAAAAFLLDWAAVQPFLKMSARRLGFENIVFADIDRGELVNMADTTTERPAIERAFMFGAQQLLAQQHALWDLLDARAAARRG